MSSDLNGAAGVSRGLRGGPWFDPAFYLSSSSRFQFEPSTEFVSSGFRLASPASGPSGVPEIDPAGIGSVLALVTGSLGLLERRRRDRR